MARRRSPLQPNRMLKRRRLLVILGVSVGVAILAGLAYAVQTNRQAPNFLRLARAAAEEREYAISVKFYEQYLGYQPGNAEIMGELAGVYEDQARSSLARPGEAKRLFDEATREYERALAYDGGRNGDRRKLAKLYIGLQKYGDGRKHVTRLLSATEFKSDPELYELLAACDAHNPAEAARHLRTAVATKTAPVDTYLRLAYLLKRDVNTPESQAEADEVMRQMVTQDRPTDLAARLARARYYLATNRRAEAQADIRFAFEKLPDGRNDPDVVLTHADAVAGVDLNEARSILQAGLANRPNHPTLALGLAEVESRAGKKAEAVQLLTKLAGGLPDTDPALADVADRLFDLADPSAAAVAKRATEVPALQPLAGYFDGRAKLSAGDWPAALPLLSKAVNDIANLPPVKRKQGMRLKAQLGVAACYAQAGDVRSELAAFQEAVKIDGASIAARLGVAEALAKLNRPDDAAQVYRGIEQASPTAQLATARAKLADAFRQPPTNPRRFDAFWDRVGKTGPYPPELLPLVANAHLAGGDAAKAEQLLDAAVRTSPTAQAFVALAAVRSAKGVEAAVEVLDAAEKKLGPTPDVRMARAAVLARDPAANAKAIAALADAPALPAADRLRLQEGIGELLLAVGKGSEGVALLKAVVQERPFDLNVRLNLFDWAASNRDTALRDAMLTDIRRIDGPDGVVTTATEVTGELRATENPTHDQIAAMTARLTDAYKRRDTWARLPYLLGVLARKDGRAEEALEQFLAAIERGERSEGLVRDVVGLLVQRQRYSQAVDVLNRLRTSSIGLPPELERQYRLLASLTADNPTDAISRLLSAEAAASKSYQDHLVRGLALARLKQPEDAKKAFDLAESLAPDAVEVYVTRGRGLLAGGGTPADVEAVIGTAEANLKKGKPAAVPFAVGQLRELQGDVKRADEEYRKAWRANPADAAAPRLLYDLHQRANARPTAVAVLDEAVRTGPADVARWARRTKALTLVDAPRGDRAVPDAVRLVQENLAAGQHLDDVRAVAFVQARDPFQRRKAMADLTATAGRGPFPPDDAFRLALLQLQAGDLDAADLALADATRSGLLANPAHLALQARVQCERNDTVGARRTVDRLKLAAPNQPVTVVEEARLLAKTDRTRATALVRGLPAVGTAAQKTRLLGQILETVGLPDAAETLYTEYAQGKDDPDTAHLPLAECQVRRGKAEAAIKLALDKRAAAPPAATARVLIDALRSRPEGLVPEAQKAAWRATADEVEQFVRTHADRDPKSAEWLACKAEIADARGRYAEAIRLYTAALGQDPKDLRGRLLNNLAGLRAVFDNDGSDDCLRLANEVIAEIGSEPSLLDTRALVRLKAGQLDAAADDLDAARLLSPSAVYPFHQAVVFDKKGATDQRDRAVALARKRGLKKESLHPLEWPDFDRLIGR